ncbi:Nucleolar protein 12 [Rhizophlyctis rosea]|uniref:Nucleolar protein 12 n=1 Tax=Rhizophlyctis rosea TaxID=64517 RepID=A0AAD5SM49_9FUNG|nr:Nucleolar protein 12 [Rhizophlyctis rosea]
MSIFQSLLGNAAIDKDLDSLFKSGPAAGPLSTPTVSPAPQASRKRKQEAVDEAVVNAEPVDVKEEGKKAKKAKKSKGADEVKTESQPTTPPASSKKAKKAEKIKPEPTTLAAPDTPPTKSNKRKSSTSTPPTNTKKPKTPQPDDPATALQKQKEATLAALAAKRQKELSGDTSDDEEEKTINGIKPTGKDGKLSRRQKRNSSEEQNERTVFVGNLPVSVTEKAGVKELKALFAKHGKLETIRFRSIAFADNKPRKAAFANKTFHPNRDSLNAYIVYASSASIDSALSENGTTFMGKHIRVDKVEKGGVKHDTKRSVFVGNLPFDVDDESLWGKFGEVGDVENVRVIRDKATNVGKGFAYVQFKDRATVGLAIKLHETELKGRKIRVTRCKKELADAKKTAATATEGTRAQRPTATTSGTKKPGGLLKKAVGGLKKSGLLSKNGSKGGKPKVGFKKSAGGKKPAGGAKKSGGKSPSKPFKKAKPASS